MCCRVYASFSAGLPVPGALSSVTLDAATEILINTVLFTLLNASAALCSGLFLSLFPPIPPRFILFPFSALPSLSLSLRRIFFVPGK